MSACILQTASRGHLQLTLAYSVPAIRHGAAARPGHSQPSNICDRELKPGQSTQSQRPTALLTQTGRTASSSLETQIGAHSVSECGVLREEDCPVSINNSNDNNEKIKRRRLASSPKVGFVLLHRIALCSPGCPMKTRMAAQRSPASAS